MASAAVQAKLLEVDVHLRAGRLAEAENLCRDVLAQEPNSALATHYLGALHWQGGYQQEGLELLRRATQLDPNVAAYWFTLAQVLGRLDRLDETISCLERAVAFSPDDVGYQYALGSLAGQMGRLDQAIEHLDRAVQIKGDFAGAYNNLGQSLCLARQVGRAVECFRKASAIDPAYVMAANNLVYYLHFDPASDGPSIRQAAEGCAARFAEPLTRAAKPIAIDRSPNRRLRVGYVSPDLYEHPVGRFIQAILASHDRAHFEVICYSDHEPADDTTAKLRLLSDGWRDTASLNDDALAQQIGQDRIDILVDLSLHMGGNRLLAFARRPAPVQVTYLGYAGTSGMSAMDWRLSDSHLDPPENDRFYTERTMRLVRSYWCYTAPPCKAELGEVRPRPPGPITFASMNNLMKVSDASLTAWAQILARVPDSRMIIHAQPGNYLRDTTSIFERHGIDPRRLEFVPMLKLLNYFQIFQHVDVVLDSFPYAGGTTTCDAMWMGVPLVTLAGQIAVQRGGVSLLHNLGLSDLIAQSTEQYIQIAADLAGAPQRLADLRSTLRQRIEQSIVMNATEFTRDLESAYRQMWSANGLSAG